MLSFFLGTSEYTVIGILPEIADGFGISLTQAGSIVSLFAFAYGLGTPFLAAYVGKYNRFRITMLGISLFALCNLICAIATNYMVFLVFRIPSLMFLDGVRLLSRSSWRLWLCWRFCL